MNLKTTATLDRLNTLIPSLKVGDQITFTNGEHALQLLKSNLIYSSESKDSSHFGKGGTLVGNIMVSRPTTLKIDLKAMFLEDGSLVVYRDVIRSLQVRKLNRHTQVALESLAKIGNGDIALEAFEFGRSVTAGWVTTSIVEHVPISLNIPRNAKELYLLIVGIHYVDSRIKSTTLSEIVRVSKYEGCGKCTS